MEKNDKLLEEKQLTTFFPQTFFKNETFRSKIDENEQKQVKIKKNREKWVRD